MLKRLLNALSVPDAVTRSAGSSDPQSFADRFVHSTILFIHLPPGLEHGLDPNATHDELLAHLRSSAQDLAERTEFKPLCEVSAGRRRMLLFTQQDFVKEFAGAFVREIKRIMPFEVLGVEGRLLVPLFRDYDGVVLNARSKHEYALSAEDLTCLRKAIADGQISTR